MAKRKTINVIESPDPQPQPQPQPQQQTTKRRKRGFDGASRNRLFGDWMAHSTSANQELSGNLTTLRNRSRDLARNNDWIRGAIRTIQKGIVGNGSQFQSEVRLQRGNKLATKTNDLLESAWTRWTDANNCDVTGQSSFNDLEGLIVRSLVESGEVLIRIIRQPFGDSKIPLALQILEADHLIDNSNLHNIQIAQGNSIDLGIETNQWGRPVAYHLHTRHPGDSLQPNIKNSIIPVPAQDIIHLYYKERPGQSRGIPWFHSSINRSRHLERFEESTLVAARASASIMGFIERGDDSTLIDTEQEEYRERDFQPGVIEQLNPGERFSGFAPTQPTENYAPFSISQLRAIASGVGISYEALAKDLERVNYSSARQALLSDQSFFEGWQSWLVRNFHLKIYKVWLEQATLANQLNLPGYDLDPDRYCKPKFILGGSHHIDPEKEITASVLAIQAGLSTLTRECAKDGLDVEQILQERRRELDLIQSLNLNLMTNNPSTAPPERIDTLKPQKDPTEEEEISDE